MVNIKYKTSQNLESDLFCYVKYAIIESGLGGKRWEFLIF